jgi:hypothetical protein
MGVILENIKRRLLGTTRPRAAAERSGGDGGGGGSSGSEEARALVQAASPQPALPTQWPAALQRSPAATAALALVSPRHVTLGGLPGELAALEQRFAALPRHRSFSKEQLQRCLAAKPNPGPQAAAKAAGRSPRRLAKGVKRPAPIRPQLRKQTSGRSTGIAAAAAAAVMAPPAATAAAPAAAALQSPPSPADTKLSRLANLWQQQTRRPAGGGLDASPGAASLLEWEASEPPAAGGLLHEASNWTVAHTQSAEAELEAGKFAGQDGWHSARQQEQQQLAAMMTPQVVAAAAEHAQPAYSWLDSGRHNREQQQHRIGAGAGGSSARRGSRSSSSSSSKSSTWRSSDLLLPPLLEGGQWEREVHRATPPAARPAAAAVSPPARSPLPIQRLSWSGLPADLLSLRESASLARQGQPGRPPLPKRRAQSVQEPAEAGRGMPNGSSGPQAQPRMQPAATAAGAQAAAAEAGHVDVLLPAASASALPAAELSEGAKRLAALRRQRRTGWHSDFASSVPSWRYSQVGRRCSCLEMRDHGAQGTLAKSGPAPPQTAYR